MSNLNKLYPIMVVLSRYSGTYEGCIWHALPEADAAWTWSDSYSDYMFGDDESALDFWNSDESKMVGRGDTPNAAVLDLLERHFGVGQWEYDDIRESTTEPTRKPTREFQKGSTTKNGEEHS